MADLLLALHADMGGDPESESPLLSLLSSHPGALERARMLKDGHAVSCGR